MPLPPMGTAPSVLMPAAQPLAGWETVDVNDIRQLERRTTSRFINQCLHYVPISEEPEEEDEEGKKKPVYSHIALDQLAASMQSEDETKVRYLLFENSRWYPWIKTSATECTSHKTPQKNPTKKLATQLAAKLSGCKNAIPDSIVGEAHRRYDKHCSAVLKFLVKKALLTTDFSKLPTSRKPLTSEKIPHIETDVDILWALSSPFLHLMPKHRVHVRFTLTEQYAHHQHGRRHKIEMLGDFVKSYMSQMKKDEIVTVAELNRKFKPAKRRVFAPTRRQWLLAIRNVTSNLDKSLSSGPLLYLQ